MGSGRVGLSQVYFYSGFDDIQPFIGDLPFGLMFSDSRDSVRAKLAEYEATRHSYRNDTWDVAGYRLSVTYANHGASIDRIACRVLAEPIPRRERLQNPDISALADAFGCVVNSPEFRALRSIALTDDDYRTTDEDGELDLTQGYGATLSFAGSGSGPVFRSITFHRNRDQESVGWSGSSPQGLEFDDSPETLFQKVPSQPV